MVQTLLRAGADVHPRNGMGHTALEVAVKNRKRHLLPLLLSAGATIPLIFAVGVTIPSDTDAYLRKVRAVGFPAYEKAHRQALATKFAAKVFPRLPTDAAGQVVAFAFHVGYY